MISYLLVVIGKNQLAKGSESILHFLIFLIRGAIKGTEKG